MSQPRKRVISLDPFDIRTETLAELKAEVQAQAPDDKPTNAEDIEILSTLVIDTNDVGGLDSHAVVHVSNSDSHERDS